jgi:DNA topoisomerase-1
MALYMSIDDEAEKEKGDDHLPDLSEGDVLKLNKLKPKQHFTAPPPRYSEASLVKELEENGIGRPSTYTAILSTIREKDYVGLSKGYFKPNELGFIVNDLLVENFPDVFDVEFTARMEDDLDRIEAAELDAPSILSRFYDPFKEELDTAAKNMLSVKGVGFPTDLSCPQCNSRLHIKMGKNGHFIACSKYPDCTYSRDYTRDKKGRVRPVEPEGETMDMVCEKCGKPMVVKHGKYGNFFACTGFPDCRNTISIGTNGAGQETGISCPQAECNGNLVQRKSKRGKIFYGCDRFPDCTFAVWDKPVAEVCPECGAYFLVEKSTKRKGSFLSCITDGCGYKKQLDTPSDG